MATARFLLVFLVAFLVAALPAPVPAGEPANDREPPEQADGDSGADGQSEDPEVGSGSRYSLGRARGTPGGVTVFQLRVTSDVPLAMVSWSVEFDPSVMELEEVTLREEILEMLERARGIQTQFEVFSDQEAGWIQAALTFDYEGREELALPPRFPVPIAKLVFRVRPDVAAGSYPVRFTRPDTAAYEGHFADGEGPVFNRCRRAGRPFDNEHRFEGEDVHRPGTDDGELFVSIIGDVGVFVRGDSNLDAEVNIADPVTILNHLFLAAGPLPCPDAADANRDAQIDLSDAVTVLVYLFGDRRTGWSPTTEASGAGSSTGLGCSL